MKHAGLFLAAALLFAAFPDAARAQSRTADGWWEWAARSERTARTDRSDRTSPRTERRTDRQRDERRAERRGTVRPSTERRRTTRRDRREADRQDRREAARRAERRDRQAERRRDRDDDRYDDDRYDRYEDRGERRRKGGPKFCRNGVGHPTKGMAWCREKGYVDRRIDRRIDRRSDRRADRRDDRWERRTIEDIIFGTPRDRSRRTRTVDRTTLGEILGRRALGDLERAATGPLAGRWVYPEGRSRVLQLRDRRGPLAELTDFDGDNRVDLFLVDRTR